MYKNGVMTVEKMKEIIKENISFNSLVKDKGIYEFFEDKNLSIGISFESEGPFGEKMDRYIYNLFFKSEYINIGGFGTKENPLPDEVVKEIVEEWNVLSMLNPDRGRTYEELKSVIGLVSKGLDVGLIKVEIDDIEMNELKVSIGDNWFWTPVSYIDDKTLLDSVPKEEILRQIVDTMLGIKEELDEDEFLYYQYYLEEGLVNGLKADLEKQMETERDGWERPIGFVSFGDKTIEMVFDQDLKEYSATIHDNDGTPRLPYISADTIEDVLKEIVGMKNSKEVMGIMTAEELKKRDDYSFECNMDESFRDYEEHDEWGCAYAWLGSDIGVEYNFCVDNSTEKQVNSCAIYKMELNEKIGYMETDTSTYEHYEIDFNKDNWREELEQAMCKALIQFFELDKTVEKTDYINTLFFAGYKAGTPLEEIISDYHGSAAKEQVEHWEKQYGCKLGYDFNHKLCSYTNGENDIHLGVGFNSDREVEFYVELYIYNNHDDTEIFNTIEAAVNDYKATVDRCLNGEFGKLNKKMSLEDKINVAGSKKTQHTEMVERTTEKGMDR